MANRKWLPKIFGVTHLWVSALILFSSLFPLLFFPKHTHTHTHTHTKERADKEEEENESEDEEMGFGLFSDDAILDSAIMSLGALENQKRAVTCSLKAGWCSKLTSTRVER